MGEINNSVLTRYLNLMMEIRRRKEVIIAINVGKSNALYKIANYEVMFLQLRKILEIIVKAPILLNENSYRSISKSPEYDWRIRDIMRKLEKINPQYYPRSIEIVKHPNNIDEFVNRKIGYLTTDELASAYDHCNNFLHSDNPLLPESEVNFENEWLFIVDILNKVQQLLNTHVFHPVAGGEFYYISMDNGKGRPTGNIFTQV